MASNTNMNLLGSTIYSVFTRNYSEEGTFDRVREDLDRIKQLGTDIIWLLPIYPVGVVSRKGTIGSPYAIKDFDGVDPMQGDEDSLKRLIDAAHEKGMKIIVDVVYNHTSHDSKLINEDKNYFLLDKQGQPTLKCLDWSDVKDLDYKNKSLWEKQIASLEWLVRLGFDGFRCDVASLVPISFWKEARTRLEKINPDLVWLAESVHVDFVESLKKDGHDPCYDSELYEAFDILYDYDIHPFFNEFIKDRSNLGKYVDAINNQSEIYPDNFIKLRFVENHDQPRLQKIAKDLDDYFNILAFMSTLKGTNLVYNGQETNNDYTPSLFELNPIYWKAMNDKKVEVITALSKLKKEASADSQYSTVLLEEKLVMNTVISEKSDIVEVSCFDELKKPIDIYTHLADGVYSNMFDGSEIVVKDSHMKASSFPVIIFNKK